MLASRSSGAAGSAADAQSMKETPILIAQPTYGLQQTHTATLPICFYLSANDLNFEGCNVKIRMNQPFNPLVSSLTTGALPGVASKNWLYRSKIKQGDPNQTLRNSANRAHFPYHLADVTNPTFEPWWWNYWSKIYEYWTVLACHWEVTISNPMTAKGMTSGSTITGTITSTGTELIQTGTNEYTITNDMPFSGTIASGYEVPTENKTNLVAWQYDSNSSTNTTTGNILPLMPIQYLMGQEQVKYERIEARGQDGGGAVTILSGSYRPGMVKRNIFNDGDVKTWRRTGNGGGGGREDASLQDQLSMFFYAHPLEANCDRAGADTGYGVNLQIRLKYVVQFKDQIDPFKYPRDGATATNPITVSTDILSSGLNQTA